MAYLKSGWDAHTKSMIEKGKAIIRQRACPHTSYSQDKTSGECRCDACGKLLIDSIGRVLE